MTSRIYQVTGGAFDRRECFAADATGTAYGLVLLAVLGVLEMVFEEFLTTVQISSALSMSTPT